MSPAPLFAHAHALPIVLIIAASAAFFLLVLLVFVKTPALSCSAAARRRHHARARAAHKPLLLPLAIQHAPASPRRSALASFGFACAAPLRRLALLKLAVAAGVRVHDAEAQTQPPSPACTRANIPAHWPRSAAPPSPPMKAVLAVASPALAFSSPESASASPRTQIPADWPRTETALASPYMPTWRDHVDGTPVISAPISALTKEPRTPPMSAPAPGLPAQSPTLSGSPHTAASAHRSMPASFSTRTPGRAKHHHSASAPAKSASPPSSARTSPTHTHHSQSSSHSPRTHTPAKHHHSSTKSSKPSSSKHHHHSNRPRSSGSTPRGAPPALAIHVPAPARPHRAGKENAIPTPNTRHARPARGILKPSNGAGGAWGLPSPPATPLAPALPARAYCG